jgi:addiction module HigA family antidote
MKNTAPIRNGMRPIHPGEVLREEYLVPMSMSANALAHAIGVPANRVSSILAGARGVTADTALRLAQAFGTTPEFWLNMQQSYDLQLAAKMVKVFAKKIRPIVESYAVTHTTRSRAKSSAVIRESYGAGFAAKQKPTVIRESFGGAYAAKRSPRRTKVS